MMYLIFPLTTTIICWTLFLLNYKMMAINFYIMTIFWVIGYLCRLRNEITTEEGMSVIIGWIMFVPLAPLCLLFVILLIFITWLLRKPIEIPQDER